MRVSPYTAGMALLLAAATTQALAAGGYRIGPKDLIEIKVYEVPELNIERRVSEEGTINLPLIGEVEAQGATDSELAEQLKDLLESKYVQRASVSVQVREFRSQPISVIGAVNQPGPLAFSGRWTLIEALTAAGGLEANHGDVLYVLRRASTGLTDQISINIDDLMLRADPKVNLPIFAGDLVNVPGLDELTVFCLGEVRSPGAVSFRTNERITLLTALARVGGLTERASRKILIKRRDATGKDVEIVTHYKRILSGKDPDVKLEPNDVIVVKESFF